jgi:hypothetical protein
VALSVIDVFVVVVVVVVVDDAFVVDVDGECLHGYCEFGLHSG